jgi:hypothetical protein
MSSRVCESKKDRNNQRNRDRAAAAAYTESRYIAEHNAAVRYLEELEAAGGDANKVSPEAKLALKASVDAVKSMFPKLKGGT